MAQKIKTGVTHYGNTDIIRRLSHYGTGGHKVSSSLLTLLTTAFLDIFEEMDKGDRLIVEGLGTFEIQLEKWRWIFMPHGIKTKFMKSRPKRWRLVFKPSTDLEKWLREKCPDEVIEYSEEAKKDMEARRAARAEAKATK